MARKKKSKALRNIIIVISIIIFLGLGSFIFGLVAQTGYPTPSDDYILLPEYSSLWCAGCTTEEQVLAEFTYNGLSPDLFEKYECNGDSYIPNGCKFEIESESAIGEAAVYICDLDVSESDVREDAKKELGIGSGPGVKGCDKISESTGLKPDVQHFFTVSQEEILYVTSEVVLSLRATYQPFCLFYLEGGRLQSLNTCEKSRLVDIDYSAESIPTILEAGRENAIENVIIGYSARYDSIDVVKDPTTGTDVFLRFSLGKIESCPIVTGDSGNRYMAVWDCKVDNRFICVPSATPAESTCIDGLEVVKTEVGGECTGNIAVLDVQERDDGTAEKCQMVCVNDKWQKGRCEDVIGYAEGKVTGEDKKQLNIKDYLPLIIGVGIGMLIFLVIVVILIIPPKRPQYVPQPQGINASVRGRK